jgi:cell division protein FtsW
MRKHAIHILLLSVACLCALGIVMLSSTSPFANGHPADIHSHVKKQSVFLVLGIAFAIGAACVDYSFWQRRWWWVLGAASFLLVLCFIPPIGLRINGSSRWIDLGLMRFQPSELAKVGSIMFLAWWFSRPGVDFKAFKTGILQPLAVLAVPMLLILMEIDVGTTALLGATTILVMFVAGVSLRWLTAIGALGLTGIIGIALAIPERFSRIMAFLDPENCRHAEGYQQWQALIAFGSGGFEGLGLGEGRQKMLYLPFAHTDFIFPMIGEELGLRISVLTVAAYLLICICGMLVAANARDRFGMLLGFGAVVLISLQAAVNIGVTTSMLPNKGMPLPFISYGGSNLIINMILVGLLINIHRHGRPVVPRLAPVLLRPHIEPRL